MLFFNNLQAYATDANHAISSEPSYYGLELFFISYFENLFFFWDYYFKNSSELTLISTFHSLEQGISNNIPWNYLRSAAKILGYILSKAAYI